MRAPARASATSFDTAQASITLDDIVDHAVGKALDLFGIEHALLKRWKDSEAGVAAAH